MSTDGPIAHFASEIGLDRLPPIFAHCLGTSERLDRVFEVDGHVYATNGKIVVRTPTPPGWDVPNPERVIKAVPEAFVGEFREEPSELPSLDSPDLRDCQACRGRKFVPAQSCPTCHGSGNDDDQDDCECPHCTGTHPCGDCEGKGEVPAGPCTHCDRVGVEGDEKTRVEFMHGLCLTTRYVSLLTKFKATAYLPMLLGKEESEAIKFTIGEDVEGRLMAARRR